MNRLNLNILWSLSVSLFIASSAHAGEMVCVSNQFPGRLMVKLDHVDDRRSEAVLELSSGPAGTIGIKLPPVFSNEQDNGETGPYDVFEGTLENGDRSILFQVIYERQRLMAKLTIEKSGGEGSQSFMFNCKRAEN